MRNNDKNRCGPLLLLPAEAVLAQGGEVCYTNSRKKYPGITAHRTGTRVMQRCPGAMPAKRRCCG